MYIGYTTCFICPIMHILKKSFVLKAMKLTLFSILEVQYTMRGIQQYWTKYYAQYESMKQLDTVT